MSRDRILGFGAVKSITLGTAEGNMTFTRTTRPAGPLEHYELRAWDGGEIMAERLASTNHQMLAELTELICVGLFHRVDVMRLRDGVIVLRWERDGKAIVQP